VLDGLIEGPPPALPPLGALAGRYLDRETASSVEFSVAPDGTLTASMNGVPFALEATADGRLSAARGAFDFIATLPDAQGSLGIEFDVGTHATYERVPTDPIALPTGLAGRYACPELGAVWTVTTPGDSEARIAVAGPLHHAGPWSLFAIEGDQLRAQMPSVLFKAWLDIQVIRGNGMIAGLEVSGARSKRLKFDRIA
jgi:hypothetical protein